MLRALIIDDEPPACDILRALLADHPHIAVVGEAGTVDDARRRLALGDYDLVLLDVQLRGGSGFDLVPSVRPGARIVFVTAFDQHALRAFTVNALDYLLKPVDPARLADAVSRLPAAAPVPAPEQPLGRLGPGDRVWLKGERGARFVFLADVVALVSCDNYSEVFVADGAHFLVRRPLKQWEAALPPELFVRVHRQALVNLAHLDRVDNPDGEAPTLRLRGMDRPVACSHRLAPELRRRLGS